MPQLRLQAMITLAIEQSTARGSTALLRDEEVLAERTWEHTWFENQQVFGFIPEMLGKAQLVIEDVDLFVAGLGPGSFAGTRIAVSAAQALALPDGKTVFGLNSGEALAYDILAETGAETVAVVGDARRQHAWCGCFARGEQWPVVTRPWSLQPLSQLDEILPGNAVVAGPDWDRLGELLRRICPGSSTLIETNRSPRACTLGLLAFRKITVGGQSEPLSPLYLHPAVHPPPRLPAR